MRMTITPFLQRYEEIPESEKPGAALGVDQEITFLGSIYKSLLLDPGTDHRNRLTSCTKVLNETSDDE